MNRARLSRDQAKTHLADCLENGRVIYTRHFRDELLADGLTMQDVLRVCKSGTIRMEPELDIRLRTWKYRIEGISDGAALAIVFSFRSDGTVFITVFRRGN